MDFLLFIVGPVELATCPQDPQVNKHITQIWDLGTRYLTLEDLEGID